MACAVRISSETGSFTIDKEEECYCTLNVLTIAISDDFNNLYTYINDKTIERQDVDFTPIGSYSGFYHFAVNGNGETMEVQNEEWCGGIQIMIEESIKRGYLIDVIFPDEVTFEDMQDFVKSHFENVSQTNLLKSNEENE